MLTYLFTSCERHNTYAGADFSDIEPADAISVIPLLSGVCCPHAVPSLYSPLLTDAAVNPRFSCCTCFLAY